MNLLCSAKNGMSELEHLFDFGPDLELDEPNDQVDALLKKYMIYID